MLYIISSCTIIACIAGIAVWEGKINPLDGMSYIEVAEDLQENSDGTASQQRLISELYVLAAVADPVYRESALLGLISNERDDSFIQELQSLRRSPRLLVPSVVNDVVPRVDDVQSREVICDALATLRQGSKLTNEQIDTLRPWSFMFPKSLEPMFETVPQTGKQLVKSEIISLLKVELVILGGAALWSADAVATGTMPVVMSMSDDIASLMKVNPTKRIRKNGRWVSGRGD